MVSQKSVLHLNLSTSKQGCLNQGNTSPGDVVRRAPNNAHPFQVGKVKEVSHEAPGLSKAFRRSPRCNKEGNLIPCNVSKRTKTLNSTRFTGAIHSPVGMLVVFFCALTNIVLGMKEDISDENKKWARNQLDYGFLRLDQEDFTHEDFLSLLDWKITGYSIGRKMQDQEDNFRIVKEYIIKLERYYQQHKKPLDDDNEWLRDFDKDLNLNIHQTWWIYVRIQKPSEEKVKYIKLRLGCRSGAYAKTQEEIEDERDYFADDTNTRRYKLFKKVVGLEPNFQPSVITISVYNNFVYEESRRMGCRIINVPPHRTLLSIIQAGTFKGTDNERKIPYYVTPEYLGGGSFPVIDCTTYVMRVVQTLGVEKNPAGWSYLNKKRGRVFKVSELNSLQKDSYVMLDDREGIYKIQQTKDGALSAVSTKGEQGASADKIDLTVFQYQGESYIKEVFKICENNDCGPLRLGIQRLTCWGDLHSKYLYSPLKGSRRNLWSGVSVENEPWSIFGRIEYNGKGRKFIETFGPTWTRLGSNEEYEKYKRQKKLLKWLLYCNE